MKKTILALIAVLIVLAVGLLSWGQLSSSTTTRLALSNGFQAGAMTQNAQLNTNFGILDAVVPKTYLTATSSAFATATTAATCVQNATAVTGATTGMTVLISPVSTPGVGAVWSGFVSSANNITINECAVATSAGGTIAFNIVVLN